MCCLPAKLFGIKICYLGLKNKKIILIVSIAYEYDLLFQTQKRSVQLTCVNIMESASKDKIHTVAIAI